MIISKCNDRFVYIRNLEGEGNLPFSKELYEVTLEPDGSEKQTLLRIGHFDENGVVENRAPFELNKAFFSESGTESIISYTECYRKDPEIKENSFRVRFKTSYEGTNLNDILTSEDSLIENPMVACDKNIGVIAVSLKKGEITVFVKYLENGVSSFSKDEIIKKTSPFLTGFGKNFIMSSCGYFLAVFCDTTTVYIYKRDAQLQRWEIIEELELPFSNVQYAELSSNGDVFVIGHPSEFKALVYSKRNGKYDNLQVLEPPLDEESHLVKNTSPVCVTDDGRFVSVGYGGTYSKVNLYKLLDTGVYGEIKVIGTPVPIGSFSSNQRRDGWTGGVFQTGLHNLNRNGHDVVYPKDGYVEDLGSYNGPKHTPPKMVKTYR